MKDSGSLRGRFNQVDRRFDLGQHISKFIELVLRQCAHGPRKYRFVERLGPPEHGSTLCRQLEKFGAAVAGNRHTP